MEKPTKFKEGDKVRVKSANLEGNIVKIYFEPKVNDYVYVVCAVKLNAPPTKKPRNLDEALENIDNIIKNIQTELKCVTVKLDSPDDTDMEKI